MRNVYKKKIALALALAGSLCMSVIPARISEAAEGSGAQGKVPEYVIAESYEEYLGR